MTLTEEQVRQFRTDGILIAEDILTNDDLALVIAEYEAWVDNKAGKLLAAGKITDSAPNTDFAHRFARLYAQSPEIEHGMDIMQARGPAMFQFLRNENLLNAVERLIGPEIVCNPIQHLRAKPPAADESHGFYNVPWHQDTAVTWEEADHSEIVTCWLPLVDATTENGCMEVLPGVWKSGLLPHESGPAGTHIRPDALPKNIEPVRAAVKKGGIVFMHRCTPHRSTPNRTEVARWSIDLRYQPAGQPTGRPFHPEFVARSRAHPETVLTDHAEWARRWEEALSKPAPRAHRV